MPTCTSQKRALANSVELDQMPQNEIIIMMMIKIKIVMIILLLLLLLIIIQIK